MAVPRHVGFSWSAQLLAAAMGSLLPCVGDLKVSKWTKEIPWMVAEGAETKVLLLLHPSGNLGSVSP